MEASFSHNIEVGDIITAYRKGIHVVVEIERRFVDDSLAKKHPDVYGKIGDEFSSLIHYRQIAKVNGVRVNGRKIYACDESHCTVIGDGWFENKIAELDDTRRMIEKLHREYIGDE